MINEESHTAINDHSYSQTSSGCQNCNEQNKDINNLKYENKKLHESIKLKQGKGDGTSVCKFIATDAKLRLNTGLPNKDVLNALYNHFSPNENRCEWKDEAEQEQEPLRPVRRRAVGV